jgi:hypothetical protein
MNLQFDCYDHLMKGFLDSNEALVRAFSEQMYVSSYARVPAVYVSSIG